MGKIAKTLGVGLLSASAFGAGAVMGPELGIPSIESIRSSGGYGDETADLETEFPPTPGEDEVAGASPAPTAEVVDPSAVIAGSPASTIVYRGVAADKIKQYENCGNETDKVLMTFDDSGRPEDIRKIMAFLRERDIAAIFFPNTKPVPQEIIDEMRQGGFWVGNHTYSHPYIPGLTDAELQEEVRRGVSTDLIRLPYGGVTEEDEFQRGGPNMVDAETLARVEALGSRICMWTLDTQDPFAKSAQEIIDEVDAGLTEADPDEPVVILAHMLANKKTIEALPGIVETVEKHGREFCPLPDAPTDRGPIPNPLPC